MQALFRQGTWAPGKMNRTWAGSYFLDFRSFPAGSWGTSTWVWPCGLSQPGEAQAGRGAWLESFRSCLGPDRTASVTAPRRGAKAQVAGPATAPPIPSQNEAGSGTRSVPHASALEGDQSADIGLGLLSWVCAGRAGSPTESMRRLLRLVGQRAQKPGFPRGQAAKSSFQSTLLEKCFCGFMQ